MYRTSGPSGMCLTTWSSQILSKSVFPMIFQMIFDMAFTYASTDAVTMSVLAEKP